MRPVVAELDPAIGRDAIAGGDLDADLAAISIALASGNEEGAGGADRKPPAVIGAALVKDIGGACLPRDGTAGDNPRLRVVSREVSEEFGGCEIIEASQAGAIVVGDEGVEIGVALGMVAKAAMGAAIGKGVDATIGIAGHDHRGLTDCRGDIIAGIRDLRGEAQKAPGRALEDSSSR